MNVSAMSLPTSYGEVIKKITYSSVAAILLISALMLSYGMDLSPGFFWNSTVGLNFGANVGRRGRRSRAFQAYLGHKNIQHAVRYTELSPHRFKDFWRSWRRGTSVRQHHERATNSRASVYRALAIRTVRSAVHQGVARTTCWATW